MEKRVVRDVLRFAMSVCFCGILASSAYASDAWVVSLGTGPIHYAGQPDCFSIRWHDMQHFFNSNATLETVRVLGLSNNVPLAPSPQNITLFGNSLYASSFSSLDKCLTDGVCASTVFVAHLDVPHGMFVSSRAEVDDSPGACPSGELKTRTLAGLPLPVVRALTPPRVLQYHLGIDAGTVDCPSPSCGSASARITIGIYNGGVADATAIIETRRGCDDKIMERRVVTVPANTVLQFGGFPSDTSGCGGVDAKTPKSSIYAVVTMDQPGFSYAISLRNDMPPYLSGGASASP